MRIPDLPFNALIGIQYSDDERYTLVLPEDPKYTNHLGTVHASALLALAEATSGQCLVDLTREVDFPLIPVVRRLESKFVKPAQGAIYSSYHLPGDASEPFLETLASRGRALLSIPVQIHDQNETLALNATVDWFVSKQ